MTKHLLKLFLAVMAVTGLLQRQTLGNPTFAESLGVGSYGDGGKHIDQPDVGSGSDWSLGIAKMPDGGYVVAGMFDLPSRYAHYNAGTSAYALSALVRFGPDGSILWEKALWQSNDTAPAGQNSKANSYVYQIATDVQGNIFVAGGKGNYNNGGQQPFVAKFNNKGGLVWDNGITKAIWKTGDNPPTTEEVGVGPFTSMGLTHDGGVVVGSSESKPGGTQSRPVICKFNSDGSLALHAVYEVPVQYIGVSAVCQAKNSNDYVFLIQHPQTGSFSPNPHGMTAIEIDPSGNVVREKSFAPDDGRIETPLQVIPTSDGGYVTFCQLAKGYSGGVIYDAGGFVLRKFDSQLNTTFEKLYQRTGTNSGYYNNHLSLTADGGFLIAGSNTSDIPNDVGVFEASLTRVGPNGNLLSVSLLGGPQTEGAISGFSPGNGVFAVQASDGGYAFTTKTLSYTVDGVIGGGFYYKGDWWIVKTDANRKVPGFKDDFRELPLSQFTVATKTRPGGSGKVTRIAPVLIVGVLVTDQPAFVFEDLSAVPLPDHPTLAIQGGSPRIVSEPSAEAVVKQHFAYHINTAFFPDPTKVTYSAAGLPSGFVLDPHTGIISGVAAAGTETITPKAIALSATDGTDTAKLTLHLTIGDGVPMFAVNGSDQPAANLADTVLTFATVYPGQRAGQKISVQSASSAQGPWTDLNTGLTGIMRYDETTDQYVLGTTNYPQQSAVWFRSRVLMNGFPDDLAVSNVVGPFDLSSSKARAGRTVFRLNANQERADFDFRVTEMAAGSDIALRVQMSRTPSVEGSWTDLTDNGGNNISAMTQDGDALHYKLLGQRLADGEGIYFRAIARSVSNGVLVDAPSNFLGPRNPRFILPPSVTINSLANGTAQSPFIVTADASGVATIPINATVTAGTRSIALVQVLFDSQPIYEVPGDGTATMTIDYTRSTNAIGTDHVIEVLATDVGGVAARAGTSPRYIRIVPSPATAQARPSIKGSKATSAFRREIFTVATSGGNWDAASTWRDSRGNPGVPTSSDFAVIGDSTVKLNGSGGTVFSLSISGGHIVGPGQLQIDNLISIYGGSFDAAVTLVVKPNAVCNLVNPEDFHFNGVLQNQGTINVHGARSLIGLQQFINIGLVNYQLPLLPSPEIAKNLPPDFRAIAAQVVLDSGKTSAQKLVTDNGSGLITNDGGSLISNDGGSLITNDGGSLITNDGGSIIGNDGASLITNDGGSVISNDGASLGGTNGGVFKTGTNGQAAAIRAGSADSAESTAATSGYVKKAGELDLNGITIIGPVSLEGGVINGSGIIVGNVTNSGGFISPGHSAGNMIVTGNLTQTSGGTMILEAAGAESGKFDQIQVARTATLGGKLDLKTISGYTPLPNDPLNQLTASTVSGKFSSVSSNGTVAMTATGFTTKTNPAATNPPAGQPLNIATRMNVLAGDNALIAGFIVTGPSGSTKKVLIRGLGPSLAQFGVSNTLSDPLLELHKPGGNVTNDNWQQGNTSLIPAGFAPSDPKEAVIVATLTPGNYSAVVKGAHGETGVGIAEVYDLDAASPAKLANISTRGFINTGDDVMIGGFIVGGNEPAKILIRAIGPTLSDFGVQGALQDPTLELHDSNGMSISNNDWRETQEAEITATTIPPSKDKEPAILATLAPGNYTAVVRGKDNTTGVGLVEAYNLQ